MIFNKFIFFNLKGGLGNQLFIYFFAYFFTKKIKKKPLFLINFFFKKLRSYPNNKLLHRKLEICKFDKINENIYIIPLILGKIIFFIFYKISFFFSYALLNDISFNKKVLKKKLFYDCHFIDFRYFIKYRSIIRKILIFDNIKQNEIIFNLNKYKKNNKNTVMIHVRRGDLIIAKGHIIDLNYYKKAMNLFKKRNVQFILFSDSPIWCSRQHIFKNLSIVREKDATNTLMMMKLCDHFILTNSTLSCWAAFLGEKRNSRIVYPKHAFIDRIDLNSGLFLKNWIGLKY